MTDDQFVFPLVDLRLSSYQSDIFLVVTLASSISSSRCPLLYSAATIGWRDLSLGILRMSAHPIDPALECWQNKTRESLKAVNRIKMPPYNLVVKPFRCYSTGNNLFMNRVWVLMSLSISVNSLSICNPKISLENSSSKFYPTLMCNVCEGCKKCPPFWRLLSKLLLFKNTSSITSST